jgi:porin
MTLGATPRSLLAALPILLAMCSGSAWGQTGSNDVFGGPGSVPDQLRDDTELRAEKAPLPALRSPLEIWFGFKDQFDRSWGLNFGLDYTALGQRVSTSPGDVGAASGIFRAYGTWTLVGRNSDNNGGFVMKIENRHSLGTALTPQELGIVAGSILPTGTAFTDYEWGVTNLFWRQRLLQGRLSFVAGTVDVTDYLDVYGLINPWTHFQNLTFLTNPAIAPPNQGLGVAGAAMLTSNIYVIGGFADANGDATKAGFDTFFEESEYFKHVEIGWTSSQDRIYLDNVHLTYWHADERMAANVPESWGLAFSAAEFLDERWLPFFRAGYSNGAAAPLKASLATGLGIKWANSDVFGVGIGWGRPSLGHLRDQYTAEMFYRWQTTETFAITPDVQLIWDPALNRLENNIAVFGLRGRAAY